MPAICEICFWLKTDHVFIRITWIEFCFSLQARRYVDHSEILLQEDSRPHILMPILQIQDREKSRVFFLWVV